MDQLLFFPYNGNAREGADCLSARQRLLGFIDDDTAKQGKKNGHRVFSREALRRYPNAAIVAVPGSPDTYLERKKIIESLGVPASRFATVIHPGAFVSKSARLGRNVLVMAGVVIGPNVRLGDHVCLLPNSVIHHESEVGDFTLIGSNVTVAGRVRVGENCYIGSGSSILQDVQIKKRTMVGMASNVIRSVPAESKVAGNPARPL